MNVKKRHNMRSSNYSHLILDKEPKNMQLQQIFGKLDVQVQKNRFRDKSITLYKNKLQMDQRSQYVH